MSLLNRAVLLALAAAAAVAVLGPGTASADTMCKVAHSPAACFEGNVYEPGTKYKMTLQSGTEAVFTGTTAVKCTGSEVKGELVDNQATPVPLSITSFTFSGCKAGFINCTVSTAHLTPFDVAVETEDGNDGFGIVSDGGKGNPGAIVNCGGLVECEFRTNSGGAELGLTGGQPATAVASAVKFELTSGSAELCGTSRLLDATYKIVEVDEPAAAPVENPATFVGVSAKITPNTVEFFSKVKLGATFIVADKGKHQINSQTLPGLHFNLKKSCAGTTLTVTDPKKPGECTAEVEPIVFAKNTSETMETVWIADGARFGRKIYTDFDMK